MSHTNSAVSPTLSTLVPPATVAGIHNVTTAAPTHVSASTQSNNQTTQNIIFGVFAIVLALVAILVGWLQLRSFKRQDCDEETGIEQPQYELIEV
jgi:hypothetical protein